MTDPLSRAAGTLHGLSLDRIATQEQGKRPWLGKEQKILISLWRTRLPTRMIAWLLRRSPMAIAVKATKLGLPPRRLDDEDQRRTSAHWTSYEIATLVERHHESLARLDPSTPASLIDIATLAEDLSRTPNSVLDKLIEMYGEDILPRIRIDTLLALAQETAELKIENPQSLKERSCLKCGAPFLSHGPHHRLCQNCRQHG